MRRFTLSAVFYDTYAIAGVVQNLLEQQQEFSGLLSEFFCDDASLGLIAPYQRHSALHVFIGWVVDGLLYEEATAIDLGDRQRTLRMFANIPEALDDLQPTRIPLETALQRYGIEATTFSEWLDGVGKTFTDADADDLYDWFQNLSVSGWIEELADRMAREVFFVVFQNRALLLAFNELVAEHVSAVALTSISDPRLVARFASQGRLLRVAPPRWVQRAVFYRDRGHCALCHKDVSGALSIGEVVHYDHVVALANGGLNDVTNIQLLCEDCNKVKAAGRAITSSHYEPWYPDEVDEE